MGSWLGRASLFPEDLTLERSESGKENSKYKHSEAGASQAVCWLRGEAGRGQTVVGPNDLGFLP